MRLYGFGLLATLVVAGCAGDAESADATAERTAEPAAEVAQATDAQAIACAPMTEQMPIEGRASPYDSTLIQVGGQTAKVCYGRPSARGRTMIGGDAVPYGRLWRTGANEPTTIHLPVAASIAGVSVQPGSYSLYTMPGLEEWVVIVNRSISQWGHESRYTDEVRAQEVGRGTAPAEELDDHVEQFTIRSEPADGGASLILEWEHTRVTIPIRAS